MRRCSDETGLIRSPWLGDIEWCSSAELSFPAGLPGFEKETRMLPVEIPVQRPFVYLQSLRHPDVCFLTLPVLAVNPRFELRLAEDDLAALKLPAAKSPAIGEDVLCVALLVPFGETVQTNLEAPVVINLHARTGAQCILAAPQGRFVLKEHGWEAVC